MSAAVATSQWELPWTSSADGRRFRNTLAICLGAMVMLGIVMPTLTVPHIFREHVKSPPPPLAQIMLDKPQIVIPPPPPPPPQVKRELLPQPQLKPDVKQPVPVLNQRVVPKPTVADARQKAAVSGLLQFKEQAAPGHDDAA